MIGLLRRMGMTSEIANVMGAASIAISISAWARKHGENEAHAERWGIFVGLWPPTFFALANAIKQEELKEA